MVVAVDGGFRHAQNLGLSVDWLVGDLDSISTLDRDDSTSAPKRVVQYPTEKDATDLELALQELSSLDIEQVTLIGVTGGRLDHALANLMLIARADWSFKIQFGCDSGWATVVTNSYPFNHRLPSNALVSLLPLGAAVTGVTTHGLYYPLSDATIEVGSTLGISNLALESSADSGESSVGETMDSTVLGTDVVVRVRSGQLLAVTYPPIQS